MTRRAPKGRPSLAAEDQLRRALRAVRALRDPLTCTELAAEVGLSPRAAAGLLTTLRSNGIPVEQTRGAGDDWRLIRYRVSDPRCLAFVEMVQSHKE